MTKTNESAYRVLVSCPLIFDDIDDFSERFARSDITYDVVDVDQQLDESELLDVLPGYDGILAGDDHLTRDVLATAESLKVVSKWGIGTDEIDFEAAEDFSVDVYNTPGAFADEVADVVIGYAIMLTRELHRVDQAVREGDWFCPRGTSLAGKTLGVVGVGSIGSAVVRRANAHEMNVIGNDVRQLPDELVQETGIDSVSRDELFREADAVSLNCALTDETHQIVARQELEHLGSGGYLINTARGQLVNQAALVNALVDGTIAGAALDVFEDEPLPVESSLTELENVILGSHNAQNTSEAVELVNERAVDNLIDGLLSR